METENNEKRHVAPHLCQVRTRNINMPLRTSVEVANPQGARRAAKLRSNLSSRFFFFEIMLNRGVSTLRGRILPPIPRWDCLVVVISPFSLARFTP